MWGLTWYLNNFDTWAILEPVTTWVLLVLAWFWTHQERVAWSLGDYGAKMSLEAIISYWPRVGGCVRCPEWDLTRISSSWVSKTRLVTGFEGWVIENRPYCMSRRCVVLFPSTPGTVTCHLLSLAWIIAFSCTGGQMLESPILPSCWHLDSLGFVLISFVLVYVNAAICDYFGLLLCIYWILGTNSMDFVFSALYYVTPEFSFNIF